MIFLVGLVVALDVAVWKLTPLSPPSQRSQPNQQSQSAQRQPDILIGTQSAPDTIRVTKSEQAATQEQEDREREMTTQRWTIGNSVVMSILTFALIVVGVLQRLTYDATLKANKMIERAYVDLSHVSPGLRPDGQGGLIVTMQMKNNGNTPADILGGRIWVASTDKPGYQWVQLMEISKIPPSFINPNDILTINDIAVKIAPQILASHAVWITGEVHYRDRFGEVQTAGYGRRYMKSMTANNLVFNESTSGLNYDKPHPDPKYNEFGEFVN